MAPYLLLQRSTSPLRKEQRHVKVDPPLHFCFDLSRFFFYLWECVFLGTTPSPCCFDLSQLFFHLLSCASRKNVFFCNSRGVRRSRRMSRPSAVLRGACTFHARSYSHLLHLGQVALRSAISCQPDIHQ